jgi:Hint domain
MCPANLTNHGTVGGAGTLEVSGTLTNDGVYYAQSGTYEMDVGTLITGTGTLVVDDGGNLVVNAGSVAASEQVSFNNDTLAAVLTIGTLATFGGVLDNFGSLDAIVLTGTTVGSDAYTPGSDGADGVLTLYAGPDQSDGVLGTLAVSPDITLGSLSALEVVNGGTIGDVPCFAAGTKIATERGEIAVESLRPGDLVRVLGDEGFAPVVWIGHRRIDCRRHPKPEAVWPVRVSAGAFGPGRPSCDLWLSPDHALFLEGVLIPVKYLMDGAAIVQVPVDTVTYYHVELPRHSVLLAEGLAAESYLEAGDRGNFANGGGVVALYPDFAALRWEAQGCAPLVVTGPELEAARRSVIRPCAADFAAAG